MKLLLENWRKYLETLEEEINEGWIADKVAAPLIKKAKGAIKPAMRALKGSLKEEEEQNVYSFDFDNTLVRYHTLEDGDVVYLGPHEENIQLVKDLAAEGNKIVIVTSRCKLKGEKKPWDDTPTPEEAIIEFGLPIEEVYYTGTEDYYDADGKMIVQHGGKKANKLRQLGVIKHWDDDEEEIELIKQVAPEIEGILVPVEGGITDRLRNKWCDYNEEMKKAWETTN